MASGHTYVVHPAAVTLHRQRSSVDVGHNETRERSPEKLGQSAAQSWLHQASDCCFDTWLHYHCWLMKKSKHVCLYNCVLLLQPRLGCRLELVY